MRRKSTLAVRRMRRVKSRILAAVLETAEGLHEASVMDQATLRGFRPLCLAATT